MSIPVINHRGLPAAGIIDHRIFPRLRISVYLAEQIIRKPLLHFPLFAGRIIHASYEKPGVLMAVRKTRKVHAPSPSIWMGAEMDLMV